MTLDELKLIYPEFFSKEELQDVNGVHPRVNQIALSALGAVAAVLTLGLILGLLTGRI